MLLMMRWIFDSSSDLRIPDEDITEEPADLRQRFSYIFFTEFEEICGVTHGAPGTYNDDQIRSSDDAHQMSNTLVRSTHPELMTFHRHRKVRLCNGSKSLPRRNFRNRDLLENTVYLLQEIDLHQGVDLHQETRRTSQGIDLLRGVKSLLQRIQDILLQGNQKKFLQDIREILPQSSLLNFINHLWAKENQTQGQSYLAGSWKNYTTSLIDRTDLPRTFADLL
jgi:hypothetical protein